jgi:hypothetical protein
LTTKAVTGYRTPKAPPPSEYQCDRDKHFL